MILPWMVYSVLVALLLGIAAAGVERCLRLFGRSARWVWVCAFIAAVSLPVVGLAVPDTKLSLPTISQTDFAGQSLATSVLRLPNRVLVESGSGALGFDSAILIVWIVSSLLLFTLFTWSWWRLQCETRSCASATVAGIPVLVSSVLGPAVVGIRKQTIVLPSWVLECEEGVRTMVARHELEHVRKGDQRMVLAALLVVLLLPWNMVLWWYSARLRLAVEVDCDLRLLRAGANLRNYSRLLLEVGTRLGPAPVAALTFARNRSSLFRRIQLMTARPRRRLAQAALALAASLTLALLACEMPLPFENAKDSPPAMTIAASSVPGSDSIMVFIQERPEPEEPDVADYMRIRPLVYIDGVRIRVPYQVLFDTLSRDRIDRIEVVKGDAAREQYGELAANGVINIYMKTVTQQEGNDSPER